MSAANDQIKRELGMDLAEAARRAAVQHYHVAVQPPAQRPPTTPSKAESEGGETD